MKILLGGRGAGKTYQLVQMVKEDPTGVYVARTGAMAARVRHDYGLSQRQTCNPSTIYALKGRTVTLYIDEFDFNDAAKFASYPVVAVAISGENELTPSGNYDDTERLIARMTAPRDLHNRFTYHRPSGDQPERYEEIRALGLDLAALLYRLCPASFERDTAINKIDEAVMWANASIARNE